MRSKITKKRICTDKYVKSGEVEIARKGEVLTSSPLGSCVAVVAYDGKRKIGGVAHIMLPGESLKKNSRDRNKYAVDAIENLLIKLHKLGALNTDIEICLVGGANVLKKENETLTGDIINSVQKTIKAKRVKVRAESLGGVERRSAVLNTENGIVHYTIGEGPEKILWEFKKKKDKNLTASAKIVTTSQP